MKRKNDYYWGLVLVFVAITIIGNMFNLFGDFNLFKMAWSIILIAFALNKIVKLEFLTSALALAILAHINNEALGLQNQTSAIYVSALLLGHGLNILFKRSKRNRIITINGKNINVNTFKGKNTSGELKGEYVRYENNFGENTRYVKSNNLKSATIENNLGTSRIYFDNVIFDPKGCVINVECNLGQVIIYLPANINLQNNLTSTLGSIKGSNSFHSDDSYPTVFLEGECNLGEIKIVTA